MQILDYDQYINSPAWTHRRVRYFNTHSRRCHACESEDHIHLHHLTYKRMGNERDADLMALCESCHDIVHRYATQRPDLSLYDATMFAIAHMRSNRATATPSGSPPPVGRNSNVLPPDARRGPVGRSKKSEKARIRELRAWHKKTGLHLT